jgi:hypothetical protein
MRPSDHRNYFTLSNLLFMLAVVFFGLASFWPGAEWPHRHRFIAIGLFCWSVSTAVPF